MKQNLEIIELGNPLLRQKADPVIDIFSSEIQSLIDQMLIAVKEARGVGLAAPQVGKMLQIFIVSPTGQQTYPHSTIDETLVVINPKITLSKGPKEAEYVKRKR